MAQIVRLNTEFLSGAAAAGIEITPPATEPDVVLALANNTSFPFRQIELGKISAKAEAGHDIKFGDGAGQVTFKGGASAFAGLGVYTDPEKLLGGLDVEENIAPGLAIANSGEDIFLVLRWGYDVNASAKGSVALGAPGSITFSGMGKREALYAVIRRFDKEIGALTAVGETARGWMLPSQVDRLDRLAPGTWLIAEVDSSVALSLGVQYGYDFNWVREAKLLGLAGDIGLRLHLGVSAALSFSASGSFAVVVSRDPKDDADHTLRFRLFRLRRKGWGFAFNAGASVQADFDDFLPEFDEFVNAVFGVHGAQVLKDLKAIEKWTNPDQSLADILGEVGVDFGMRLLEEVTGIDPEAAFNEARDRLVKLVDKWNALPHAVATRIWKLVEEGADLSGVRRIARVISEANQDTVRRAIADLLNDVDFFQTAAGAWLQAAAARGILRALDSSKEFGELQEAARKTLELLDPDTLEGALVRLQEFVERHLRLDQLFDRTLGELFNLDGIDDLGQVSFDDLDAWLKARLSAFIESRVDLTKINEIRKAIFLFIKRGRGFYDQTLKALNRKYEFNLAYTFQSTTTKTALLDFTLDFDQPQVIEALRLALGGSYDTLLAERLPGVTLNAATLTHQIERSSHLEINLPWSKSAVDHITTSLAKVDAVDEDEGRLFIYELDSKNIVAEKNKRNSRLAVGGFLKSPASRVRVHSTGELNYSYALRQVKKRMKRADLQYQLKPYVQTYFGGVFKPLPGGGGTFENWIGDLDNHIDALEFNGTDNFGDTLLSLEVSLPAAAVSAWLSAPPEPEDDDDKVPQYLNMSRRIQARMRQIIPLVYFQDLNNFGRFDEAVQLLVYSAMPPSTSIRLDGDKLTINRDKDYYWNWPDEGLRRAMVRNELTRNSLSLILHRVHDLLFEAGMTGTASFYRPDRAKLIQDQVASDDKDDSSPLARLLFAESQVIRAARRAGFAIAEFTAAANSKPSEAVKGLAEFGSTITRAFNEKVSSVYGGGAIRPLGTALFIEAAATLNPSLAASPSALLELIVLRNGAAFQLPDYLTGTVPKKDQILVQERIVNVS